MRDMPGFSKDMRGRICLRYAKICRTPGSKCQNLDTTMYGGIILFLEIFAQYSQSGLFVLPDRNLGEIQDFKLGQFNQVDLLFVLHE